MPNGSTRRRRLYAAGLVEQQPALRTFKLTHLRAAHRQNGQVPTEKIIGIIRKFVLFIGGYGCTAFHMRIQECSAILGEQTEEYASRNMLAEFSLESVPGWQAAKIRPLAAEAVLKIRSR